MTLLAGLGAVLVGYVDIGGRRYQMMRGRVRRTATLSVILEVLLLAGFTLPTTPAFAISGGRPVQDVNAYPYVGLLTLPTADSGKYQLCTSVLVAPAWVLTAKHCFTDHGYNSAVGPISITLKKVGPADPGIQRDARELVLGNGFDLALLRVDPVIEIQSIELVSGSEKNLYKNGTVAKAIGWGGNPGATVAEPGTLNEGAQKIAVQVYSQAQVVSGYNYLMKATPYAGSVAEGDSGGPLISETVNSGRIRHVLIGIVSQGNRSNDGVYTKVESTYVWITNRISR
jgi:secreted trypsin-like serine protease